MRRGTILVLLGLILLFAYFGWAAFGILALTVLVVVAVAIGAVAFALWRIKRTMRRNLERLTQVLVDDARARPGDRGPAETQARRADAIDVEGRVRRPRDGADDPDALNRGGELAGDRGAGTPDRPRSPPP